MGRNESAELQIVPDGVITPDFRKLRVVHILKEPTNNCWEDGLAGAARASLQDGCVSAGLFRVTAYRSCAARSILEGRNGVPKWDQLIADSGRWADALRASAILNLNDTIPAGVKNRSTSTDPALLQSARPRWPHFVKRLMALQPRLVICGGTTHVLKMLLAENRIAVTPGGDGVFVWNDVPFVTAYHPSHRRSRRREYDEQFAPRMNCAAKML